jgi:deoxyribodipyrimidine photo-lyase
MDQMNSIDPKEYGKTRNYLNGAVTYLSPYISRGFLSTKQVYQSLLDREIPFSEYEKLLQELAWRDYWQLVWNKHGNEINEDLKYPQSAVDNFGMSVSLVSSSTGIEAIDKAVVNFKKTGYLHNHLRMYIASISCNIANNHWQHPAKWMYYNLLDGDWASNTLSWQWVAGTNSSKKYFANQDNINRFCDTQQTDTFLSVEYDEFPMSFIPDVLKENRVEALDPFYPKVNKELDIKKEIPTCIYNYYNLDPQWKSELNANRIFLIEPSVFDRYPVSEKCLNFALSLSENIKDIQIFVGEFDDLKVKLGTSKVYFKQHPFNTSYEGIEDSRDFIFDEKEHLNSFFSFWKRCKKELNIE